MTHRSHHLRNRRSGDVVRAVTVRVVDTHTQTIRDRVQNAMQNRMVVTTIVCLPALVWMLLHVIKMSAGTGTQ